MGFAEQMQQHIAKLERKRKALVVNCVSAVETSIKKGSPVTGAPGQPVDTANLLNSWQTEWESPSKAAITTNVDYAEHVEDRTGPFVSEVGGAHSVKLTIAGWPRIAEDELGKLDR